MGFFLVKLSTDVLYHFPDLYLFWLQEEKAISPSRSLALGGWRRKKTPWPHFHLCSSSSLWRDSSKELAVEQRVALCFPNYNVPQTKSHLNFFGRVERAAWKACSLLSRRLLAIWASFHVFSMWSAASANDANLHARIPCWIIMTQTQSRNSASLWIVAHLSCVHILFMTDYHTFLHNFSLDF